MIYPLSLDIKTRMKKADLPMVLPSHVLPIRQLEIQKLIRTINRETVRKFRRHACSVMVKISLQHPGLLVQQFDYIKAIVSNDSVRPKTILS